jgi:hypothetical protein
MVKRSKLTTETIQAVIEHDKTFTLTDEEVVSWFETIQPLPCRKTKELKLSPKLVLWYYTSGKFGFVINSELDPPSTLYVAMSPTLPEAYDFIAVDSKEKDKVTYLVGPYRLSADQQILANERRVDELLEVLRGSPE